jgi:hypothetical protein
VSEREGPVVVLGAATVLSYIEKKREKNILSKTRRTKQFFCFLNDMWVLVPFL